MLGEAERPFYQKSGRSSSNEVFKNSLAIWISRHKNFDVYKRSEFFKIFLSKKVDGSWIPVGKAADLLSFMCVVLWLRIPIFSFD